MSLRCLLGFHRLIRVQVPTVGPSGRPSMRWVCSRCPHKLDLEFPDPPDPPPPRDGKGKTPPPPPPDRFVKEETPWPSAGRLAENFRALGKAFERIDEDAQEAPTVRAKHAHYYKDVSGLAFVDVYRVLHLFGVTDPCIQHAVKKLLVAGGRGAGKDVGHDIDEAIDALRRWQDMRSEER